MRLKGHDAGSVRSEADAVTPFGRVLRERELDTIDDEGRAGKYKWTYADPVAALFALCVACPCLTLLIHKCCPNGVIPLAFYTDECTCGNPLHPDKTHPRELQCYYFAMLRAPPLSKPCGAPIPRGVGEVGGDPELTRGGKDGGRRASWRARRGEGEEGEEG